MGDSRRAYRVLVQRPERKRTTGKPRRRREENMNMYLKEVDVKAWNGLIWLMIGTGFGRL
jgi:hypothetical protein